MCVVYSRINDCDFNALTCYPLGAELIDLSHYMGRESVSGIGILAFLQNGFGLGPVVTSPVNDILGY
jgi:hypothetical protein